MYSILGLILDDLEIAMPLLEQKDLFYRDRADRWYKQEKGGCVSSSLFFSSFVVRARRENVVFPMGNDGKEKRKKRARFLHNIMYITLPLEEKKRPFVSHLDSWTAKRRCMLLVLNSNVFILFHQSK